MKKQIADFWSKNAPYLGYDDPYISRFMAKPSEMQSYFAPRKSKECKHYWECEQIPLSEIK